ncbi:nicotinic acid mononucleotide adenylyltransferase [Spiroplasma chinense]|uniref:Probable nicotinate-nucleotide adenylyltransferase n=1 Tax=Spiroplasma chinense TaxID=216932 RepID=A0A5B9Y7F2_9MOLU|nr:nicotinate-nucleotide adenylyltransferase [Spiroplasma chinense]QEH62032.1 nicotinic acid mononucleotide adenylyltransferase [Spiroplasma chinense]
MKKVAIFGGSFDPIHTDHVNIMKACHEKLGFEEVWIVPAYVNPFKTLSSSSVTQRLEMINIAIKGLDFIRLETFEVRKHERSYTYDTVCHFQKSYPDIEFSFIMGSDQLDSFENWDHFSDLIKSIDFKVFLRSDVYNKDIVEKYNLETFTFENNFLSSTKIRNLEDLNLQIKEVNDYVNNKLMFLYERVESKMDEERYFHSLNVGQEALLLAQLNNYDLNKALVAGTLHDVAKRWTIDEMKSFIAKYDKSLLSEPEPVLHSFAGAFHLKYDWLLDDQEVVDAVFKHTVGDKEMSTLDMIVFCADKISSERNYPDVEKYRALVYSDLKTGFISLLEQQYNVAVKKHGPNSIGQKLIETYSYWVKGE